MAPLMSPGKNSPGYQKAYQGARSRSASWVRENLPAVWAAALKGEVDEAQIRAELRAVADRDELEMP
jgi:hypothetical protein